MCILFFCQFGIPLPRSVSILTGFPLRSGRRTSEALMRQKPSHVDPLLRTLKLRLELLDDVRHTLRLSNCGRVGLIWCTDILRILTSSYTQRESKFTQNSEFLDCARTRRPGLCVGVLVRCIARLGLNRDHVC